LIAHTRVVILSGAKDLTDETGDALRSERNLSARWEVPRFPRNDMVAEMNEARDCASNCSSGKVTNGFGALN